MQYCLAFFISACFITTCIADNLPAQVPTDLMYLGKPIDSLCFNLDANSNTIQLNTCGIKKEKYTLSSVNSDLIKKGYVGFDWKDTTASYPAEGYSYYKIFPADNQQYWIYTINNGGGSGEFTAINLVKRKNADTLAIKTIIGGDRCNGGIQDVQQQNNQLKFSVNLTAFDILALTNENPHQLKAYDDLAACAVCCFGKAYYEVNSSLALKLMYVELDTSDNFDDLSTQGKYQQCFNELFKQYVTQGKTKLNEAQLKQFGKEFNEKCVK